MQLGSSNFPLCKILQCIRAKAFQYIMRQYGGVQLLLILLIHTHIYAIDN